MKSILYVAISLIPYFHTTNSTELAFLHFSAHSTPHSPQLEHVLFPPQREVQHLSHKGERALVQLLSVMRFFI